MVFCLELLEDLLNATQITIKFISRKKNLHSLSKQEKKVPQNESKFEPKIKDKYLLHEKRIFGLFS